MSAGAAARVGARSRPPRRLERVEDDRADRHLGIAPAVQRALDDVLQLADVARPRVGRERRRGRVGEAGEARPAELDRHPPPEMAGEKRDVVGAGAQRRQSDDLEAQPVEQVGAEPPALGERRQVLVGRADDADIDADDPVRAESRQLAIFDDAEQPLLRRGGQRRDLVEEQRAAVGILEPPGAGPRVAPVNAPVS